MKLATIYLITHRESGRAYVGVTTRDPQVRWAQHTRDPHSALAEAFKEFGVEAFDFEVLERVDVAEAIGREDDLIRELGTLRPNGFNRTARGCTLVRAGRRPGILDGVDIAPFMPEETEAERIYRDIQATARRVGIRKLAKRAGISEHRLWRLVRSPPVAVQALIKLERVGRALVAAKASKVADI